MILKKIKDLTDWNYCLKQFSKSDIFFEQHYINIIQDCGGYGIAEAVYYESDKCKVFYPYLRRSLDLPWIPNVYKNYVDVTSPFGAGGYLWAGDIRDFFLAWNDFVKEEKIVSEFIRFHPFFIPPYLPYETIHISDFVYINLNDYENLNDVFHSFRRNHKRNIKFAEKAYEVTKISIFNFCDLHKIFTKSKLLLRQSIIMENILRLYENYPNSIICLGILKDNKIAEASLSINGNSSFFHYFLAGRLGQERGFSTLLLWEAIKIAFHNKVEIFSLGGGVSLNDSIFLYKKGFSQRMLPYKIAKIIHNFDIYEACTKARIKECKETANLFPSYRIFC